MPLIVHLLYINTIQQHMISGQPTRLGTLLWQYGIDRWINRNEFLYAGKTVEDRLRKRTLEIDSLVQRLHSKDRNRVRPVDKQLFDMSLPHRLAQTLH